MTRLDQYALEHLDLSIDKLERCYDNVINNTRETDAVLDSALSDLNDQLRLCKKIVHILNSD